MGISFTKTIELIEQVLREAFPTQKFSLKRTERGNRTLSIRWTDGPSEAQVYKLTRIFEGQRFIPWKGASIRLVSLDGEPEAKFAIDMIAHNREISAKLLKQAKEAYPNLIEYDEIWLKAAELSLMEAHASPTAIEIILRNPHLVEQ